MLKKLIHVLNILQDEFGDIDVWIDKGEYRSKLVSTAIIRHKDERKVDLILFDYNLDPDLLSPGGVFNDYSDREVNQ